MVAQSRGPPGCRGSLAHQQVRPVRAFPVTGEERDRLWKRWVVVESAARWPCRPAVDRDAGDRAEPSQCTCRHQRGWLAINTDDGLLECLTVYSPIRQVSVPCGGTGTAQAHCRLWLYWLKSLGQSRSAGWRSPEDGESPTTRVPASRFHRPIRRARPIGAYCSTWMYTAGTAGRATLWSQDLWDGKEQVPPIDSRNSTSWRAIILGEHLPRLHRRCGHEQVPLVAVAGKGTRVILELSHREVGIRRAHGLGRQGEARRHQNRRRCHRPPRRCWARRHTV